MQFKFLVAKTDIPGMPGLETGDAVIPAATEIMPGGYEYDVWHRLDNGLVAKTRHEHRGDLITCEVDGRDKAECTAKVAEVSEGVRRGKTCGLGQ